MIWKNIYLMRSHPAPIHLCAYVSLICSYAYGPESFVYSNTNIPLAMGQDVNENRLIVHLLAVEALYHQLAVSQQHYAAYYCPKNWKIKNKK